MRLLPTLLSAIVLATPQTPAPTYTPHMSFDVVSIHKFREGGGMRYVDNPANSSSYKAVGADLRQLIMHAYDIRLFNRLENLPNWSHSESYVVEAKADSATDEAISKLSHDDSFAEKRNMLKQLLADRFHLQIHAETRTAKTYELIATPRAAKLMTQTSGDIGKTISTCAPHVSVRGVEYETTGCPFRYLLSAISQMSGTEVIDHTGLSGNFAYHLMFSNSGTPDEDHYPALVDAVREQLGLELKETKGPVTFWVIDHVERPTDN